MADSPQERRSKATAIGRILAFVLAPLLFAGSVAGAKYLLGLRAAEVHVAWSVLALLGGAVLLGMIGAMYHLLVQWHTPVRKLEEKLAQVKSGSAPIDDLATVGGRLSALAEQIRQIMRELRQQKSELARAQAEMSQRVAHRTDVLEYMVGSLRLQASLDPLTGLYNRRMFEQHISLLLQESQSMKQDFSLVILDLDNFKLLNDTVGHAAGDEFLKSVGQLIRSGIRQNDLGFRWGGDEFVVVLPQTGPDAAAVIAQRLVRLVNQLGKSHKLARTLGISAGLVSLSQIPEPRLDKLIEEADRRLYAIKESRQKPAAA